MPHDPTDCIFCSIVAGDAESSVVYRDDRTLAFMALHPMNPGHILVVPRTHAVGLADLAPADAAALVHTAQRVAAAIRGSDGRVEGIRIFLNDGAAAGQDVFHAHLHVLPRWTGDGLPEPLEPDEAARAQLDHHAAAIRSALS